MKNAVITGAGSGVGQATALALVKQGWRVAILGRRAEALAETTRLAGNLGARILAIPCDIGDPDAVAAMAENVLKEFGEVEVLVNAAGTNAPKRALEVLSLPDYHDMMNANLHGAYYCVQAFLPGMRARGSGTIVNVVSDAGKQASQGRPRLRDVKVWHGRADPKHQCRGTRTRRARLRDLPGRYRHAAAG
jgi:NAD(P)-dependent dehydrogenase (short-subunit alcohol dehydrogenase family)